MDKEQRNKEYKDYVTRKAPNTKPFKSLFWAFVIGGVICCLGEAIKDIISNYFPQLYQTEVNTWMLIVLIFIAILFTGIGIWDRVGYLGGAGAFLPITGFANAVASPSIEFKKEGLIFGLAVKMFIVAGPIIVNATAISVVAGILYLIF